MNAKEKKVAYMHIKSGEAPIVIGTHAVLQEKMEFKDLGLVVIDEQHRFGVKQRKALYEKGKHPHLISMSATPIPRTLGNILYGGMDISIMKEKPAHRLEIRNCVAGLDEREKAYSYFLEGKIRVLVSTTVVEVGVNVPNATVIMIENADRFGMLQLHQIRGRVGRGGLQDPWSRRAYRYQAERGYGP